VLAIVEDYAEPPHPVERLCQAGTRAGGLHAKVVEQLTDAIEPDHGAGEPPLLPVINRFRPYGSTAEVRFTTTRPCHPTFKSHIDQVVLDTRHVGTLGGVSVGGQRRSRVFARNDHLGLGNPV
jgi:type III restriction enzyme